MVQLYKRYKDDSNLILEVDDNGGDDDDDEDLVERTMERVKQIAEGIDPALKVSVSHTKNYPDEKLRVLDLKVWIGEDRNNNIKILHSHYMKEVASRMTIHHRSSHSAAMKKNVLVNEISRILRNCSEDLPREEAVEHVNYLMKRMQFSEYPKQFRTEVALTAMTKYEAMMEKKDRVDITTPPPSQPQPQTANTQEDAAWYSKEGYDSVMFVEATEKSKFAREVRKAVKKLKLSIKVVERAGPTIKSILQRSNPFGIQDCGRGNCLLCAQGEGGDCRTRGCVYEMKCEDCGRMYRGQTGRTEYFRGKEHLLAWIAEEDDCPLQRHANLYHNGGPFEVSLRILAECFGKPSRRMITEAVLIDEIPRGMTMNSKSEWTYVKLNKVQVPGRNEI